MSDSVTALIAALAGRYDIERELGAGGMATVYLAQDIKHDRQVAVKVLRPELSAVLGPERFLKEIKVTANLQHPHILPLFDSGQVDSFLFYVMPFVQGESLADKLRREKQLAIEESVEIAVQVASALGYAHKHHVVHRDIKPDNIMITSGHAVVADFGIARAVDAAGGEQLTGTGMAIGTPAYMSPEQSLGESGVDGRADIYALGSVLYELLAGEPPFTGPTAGAIIAKRMSAPIPRVRVLRETVPEHLDLALTKAMQRAPADRFATAAEFASALRGETGAPRSSTEKTQPVRAIRRPGRIPTSLMLGVLGVVALTGLGWWALFGGGNGNGLDPNAIAVLPFRVGGDPASGYLRESMLDLLGARLTGETGPRVVESRTTLSAWRRAVANDADDLSENDSRRVAAALGAGQLILGNAVATPTELTLAASLIRVSDGALLASGSALGPRDSVTSLVNRLTAQLLSQGAGEGRDRLEGLATTSLEALQQYLAGRKAYRDGDPVEAIRLYGNAFALDTNFVQAGFGMVSTNNLIGDGVTMVGRFAGPAVWRQRERLSTRDLSLLLALPWVGPNFPAFSSYGVLIAQADAAATNAPDSPEHWLLLGQLLSRYGAYSAVPNWADRASQALDRAIALDSSFATAWQARLFTAMLTDDPEVTRRIAAAYEGVATSELDGSLMQWAAAVTVGDSVKANEWRERIGEFSQLSLLYLPVHSIRFGLPLSDAHRAVEALLDRSATLTETTDAEVGMMALAFVEGRVQDAIRRVEGFVQWPRVVKDWYLISMALFEAPYRETAMQVGARVAAAYPIVDAGPGMPAYEWRVAHDCHSALLRAVQGDTSTTREAIRRLRSMTEEAPPPSTFDAASAASVQGFIDAMFAPARIFPVCSHLLETMLDGPERLDALDSLMRTGPQGAENMVVPASFANLIVARMREEQGDTRGALATIRRRLNYYNPGFLWPLPTFLREEGRLAALVGDNAGAIRAYEHYLTLRTNPDRPLRPQRDSVVVELAALVGN